jgi:hypothetical protein
MSNFLSRPQVETKKTFESAIKTRIAHEIQTTFFLQQSKKELDL